MIPTGFADRHDRSRFLNEGFLVIKISDLVQRRLEDTFGAATPFFQATHDEKMKAVLPLDMGYRPFAAEYSQSADRPD